MIPKDEYITLFYTFLQKVTVAYHAFAKAESEEGTDNDMAEAYKAKDERTKILCDLMSLTEDRDLLTLHKRLFNEIN